MIRFYVGEEPVLRSVPTYDLAQPDQLEEALDVFDELVLKPRAGHGGVGVLIAPRATREEIEATREAVIADPGAWIAQRMVMLSTHPTVVEGGRPRARATSTSGRSSSSARARDPRVLPGGLTRVARSEGAAGRQLVAERRREGHLGHALSARGRRASRVARVAGELRLVRAAVARSPPTGAESLSGSATQAASSDHGASVSESHRMVSK